MYHSSGLLSPSWLSCSNSQLWLLFLWLTKGMLNISSSVSGQLPCSVWQKEQSKPSADASSLAGLSNQYIFPLVLFTEGRKNRIPTVLRPPTKGCSQSVLLSISLIPEQQLKFLFYSYSLKYIFPFLQ